MTAALGGGLIGLGVVICGIAVSWPGCSWWLARRRGRGWQAHRSMPNRVTVVIAARNEAGRIGPRVRALPTAGGVDLFRIVVSDGSTDETAAEARAAGADLVLELPRPLGKTRAMARGVARARAGDILVFTDATSRFDAAALHALLAPFADPDIGAVSGLVLYDYPETAAGEGFRAYQAAVVGTRVTDAHWFSTPSVSGAMCALRPELWDADVPDDITTDLAMPLWAARADQRAALATDAICIEHARAGSHAVFRARVRMALQAYAFLHYAWRWRRAFPVRYSVALIGHKVARWLVPLGLVCMALGGLILWPVATLAALLMPPALYILARVPGVGRLLAGPHFALVVAAAYLVGFVRYLSGERAAIWRPDDQRRP